MAPDQQAIANRNNAAKSTGPKTEAGKAKVSGNALKHGLRAAPQRALLHDEDPQALDALRDALGDELRPSTPLQCTLFDLIVSKLWRLMRVSRIETDILEGEVAEDHYQLVPSFGADGLEKPGSGAVLGRAFRRTVFSKEMLTQVQRYETSLERGLLRLLGKYDELQARQAV